MTAIHRPGTSGRSLQGPPSRGALPDTKKVFLTSRSSTMKNKLLKGFGICVFEDEKAAYADVVFVG